MNALKDGIQSPPSRKLPSLFTELTTALVLLVTLVSVVGGVINYLYFSQQVQRDQQNRSAEYAEYLRDSLEWPLWNIDDELIAKIGTAFAANPEMATLIVRDEEQRVIYRHAAPQTLQNRQVIAIDHDGHPIGSVEFGVSLASYEEREHQLWLTSLATIGLLVILLIGAIRWILSRMLRKPIDAMITATQDMVDGKYQQIMLPASYQEFTAILTGFKTMSEAVASREDRLREANAQLTREVAERVKAEQELCALNATLEQRITERTRELTAKTAELAQTSERLQLAMEASTDGIWDRNIVTGESYYSPGYFTMLGYQPDEFPHDVDSWRDLLHPDDRNLLMKIEPEEFASNQFEQEFRMRTKQGSYRWIYSRGRIITRDESGNPLRAVGTHVDITERKEANLALEESERRYRELSATLEQKVEERTAQLTVASAAKTQFLGHMSHELRTPMNAVLGLAQLLEKEALAPGQLAMVRHIRESGDSLLHIINEILDFSKIEAGQLRFDSQPFSVAEVLSRVDTLLRLSAESKGLVLEVKPSPTDLGVLMGDPQRVEQILINLIGNAIKFTAQGGVTVSARSVATDATSTRVRIEVQDTGIGIAPEAISKLFLPFSQADASITRSFGGTGLGLAISRRLVDLMGGQMGVTSEVGQGSTFWFEVPLQKAPGEKAEAEAEIETIETRDTAPVGPQLTGLRVLAVDDSRLNLMVVERALKLEGWSVTLAADGQQALQILKAQPQAFDVVLMDIQMPVMDGLTATREIRKDSILAQLPVIALTAGVLPEERQAALDAGVDGFLAKPLDLQQILQMLSQYL